MDLEKFRKQRRNLERLLRYLMWQTLFYFSDDKLDPINRKIKRP